MAKRKRSGAANGESAPKPPPAKKAKAPEPTSSAAPDAPVTTIQIVTGSYDRVLHGIQATLPAKGGAEFTDTFLLEGHDSSIRCLALSPPSDAANGQPQKVTLATGGTDNMIHLYSLSAHPPRLRSDDQELSSLAGRPIRENLNNRKLGSLHNLHQSTITHLAFPSRSKLLSSSEDSTVAVTRTRDWATLSVIKAPIPKAQGRPSGDTAPMGGVPSGVNDFAIHPSMKLMISVSKGERCMRLWNLLTGKKAGVLNLERGVLQAIGEGRHSTGEGRRVVWGSSAGGGDEFAVGFDRDVLVFGMDSTPRCHLMPDTRHKVHEISYVRLDEETDESVLAVSTEDGRILFFSTKAEDMSQPGLDTSSGKKTTALPAAKLVTQLGGSQAGISGRIKDFKVLQSTAADGTRTLYVVSASSDGKLRIWTLRPGDLRPKGGEANKQAGRLLGTYEGHNRITCVTAFVMIPNPEGEDASEVDSEDEKADEGPEQD